MTHKVIVPLRAKTWLELNAKLNQLDNRVDMIEIWTDQLFIDLMRQPQLLPQVATRMQELKKDLSIKVLAVCKSPQERGQFGGTPAQRIEILQAFLQLGGDFVDVDVKLNHKDLIRHLPKEKLWLSLHDFTSLPDNLEHFVRDMKMIGPCLYKFAVSPQSQEELQQFIQFAKEFDKPAIFTTMGPLGASGREELKNISWGGFYALNQSEITASGQPTLADL